MAEGYELNYFPLRGRGEVIRLALIAAGASYTEVSINYADMKEFAGTSKYPFGQAPTFHHNGIILAQMDAILRYVARLHNLYGENIIEQSFIDMVLIGVEGLRTAYTDLIYGKQLSEEGRLEHFRKHLSKETEKDRNGGSHFAYFEALLARNNNGTAFVVGNNLSIADIQLFDLVDLHLREAMFPKEIQENFPLLFAHHERVAAIPAIAAYLSSDKRHAKVNGNSLG